MMEKAESAQERGLSAAGMSETAAAHGEAAEAVRREKKARRRPDDGTEFCGVRRTPSGKYQAQIWDRSRRTVCLGTFGTAEEAAGAFDAAVVRLRGAAKTNSKIPAAVQPSASVTVVTAESAGNCEIAEEHGGGVEAVERRGKKALPEEYYERTKDSPAGRNDGKTCRFFQQVEVLHGPAGTASLVAPPVGATAGLVTPVVGGNLSFSTPNTQADQDSDDEGTDDMGEQGKRKRTPEGGAADGEGPMKQEMEWQEAMQRWFVEAIEKREQDRMIREEAWRRQEMARLAREQEILAQERAMVATRNATVLSFIPMPSIDELPIRFMPPPAPSSQTLAMPTAYAIAPPPSSQTLATPTAYAAAPLPSSQTHALPIPYATPIAYAAAPPPSSQPPATTQPQEPPTMPPASGSGGGGGAAWSLPWSRAEVHALIQLRNNLDMRRKGPKVSLWDDISAGMRRLGYIRSSKRCMQKWRRMNEYFRKMKESNKKRPEVSKKCPFYFHQLEALSRNKAVLGSPAGAGIEASSGQNMTMPPSSQAHATTIAYAAAPQKPTLVVHQISTDIVMTPAETAHDASGSGGGGGAASSSLWSKEEVHALIQLRWNLYTRRKRVSWEEISADMRRMGYSRSSKRCMQKWENMNSYFKKTMERNEKRPDDSKTYPSYFHQLEALYRDKAALGYPAGAGGAANAAPQDRVEAFTVTAPISQRDPPLYILPPVAKNGVTREMDFTDAVA